MASIDDWRDKAKAVNDSMNYESDASSGSVYVNRTAADRASDAGNKATLDAKLAKLDESGPVDKEFQEHLEIYLDAVKIYTRALNNLEPALITKDISSRLSGCKPVLEKALDDGTTKVFSEHPEMCKLDSD